MRRAVPIARSLSLLLVGAVLAAAGCGSFEVNPQPSPTPTPPTGPAVVVITASGVEPQVIHVWEGRHAFIENRDNKPHALYSDVHPSHGECGGKVNVGMMQPGERREITDMPYDACYFHDDTQPGARAFTGVLVVH
jgi:hypothetical protein